MKIQFPNIKNSFRAMNYRNFRLFFFGQGLSLIGTWMQNVALSWLIYKLTNSIFLLGLVGFLSQIMIFLLGPFAGVLADKYDRKKILLITESLAMIQAFVLTVLVLTNTITVFWIMLLSFILGLIFSFEAPTRQAFVIDIIEHKKDLGNAIAINSSIFNGARIIGPAIAGFIVATMGEGVCFLINAISYFAVIISLLMMRIEIITRVSTGNKMLKDIKEGFLYIYNFPPVRDILLLLAFISFMGVPYVILLPPMAKDILHGGPQTLGLLMVASGFGALLGAFFMANKKNIEGLEETIAVSTAFFALALMCLAFSTNIWLSVIIIIIAGFNMMMQLASCNTLIQTLVDDDKRGRVMSIYTIAFLGMLPFGSLVAGAFAQKFGIPLTLFLGGAICLLFTTVFAYFLPKYNKLIKPIYLKMNAQPEIKKAINMVSGDLVSETE